jgi:hypothetical protein
MIINTKGMVQISSSCNATSSHKNVKESEIVGSKFIGCMFKLRIKEQILKSLLYLFLFFFFFWLFFWLHIFNS